MQMLPATAYVKMVDIWLIFGQLVPFAEVVLLTAMEYIREGDGSGEEETTTSPQVDQPDDHQDIVETNKGVQSTEPSSCLPKQHEMKMFWLKLTGTL